jgi:predicted DNA binding protein
VRALLQGAVIQAFGESADERLLREVLERGYFDPDAKHELVASRLNLSRTAYFRRLRIASQRLATWLVEDELGR